MEEFDKVRNEVVNRRKQFSCLDQARDDIDKLNMQVAKCMDGFDRSIMQLKMSQGDSENVNKRVTNLTESMNE